MFWLIDWGVSCSQGGCRENQDGWFVTIPRSIRAERVAEKRDLSVSDIADTERNKASGYSKGVWNLDPITHEISRAGNYDNPSSRSSPTPSRLPSSIENTEKGVVVPTLIDQSLESRSPESSSPGREIWPVPKSKNKGDSGVELDLESINIGLSKESLNNRDKNEKGGSDSSARSGLAKKETAKTKLGLSEDCCDSGGRRIDEAFPMVFPLFPLPPPQPKKTGPSWAFHTSGGKSCSNLGNREILRSCQFFGLLDGHGHYGKTASHLAAYCMSETIVKGLSDIRDDTELGDYMETVLEVLSKGFGYAHESIIKANISSKKDFGTTCIVVGIVDKYLVTANCGDSSAICIVPNQNKRTGVGSLKENGDVINGSGTPAPGIRLPDLPLPIAPRKKTNLPSIYNMGNVLCGSYTTNETDAENRDTESADSRSYHKIYYLSNPHCLARKSERQRIDQSGVGKVVLGDYGMLRLIPSYLSYQQARDMGLSISMSRSLGHMHLSRCALLPTPDYRIFNIGMGSPKKESLRSIRDGEVAKREDERMISFSEALVEQSVISLGWRGSRLSNNPSARPLVENIEVEWSSDEDSSVDITRDARHWSPCDSCKPGLVSSMGRSLLHDKSKGCGAARGDGGLKTTSLVGDEEWEECYIVIMSDGISDILDGFSIADVIMNSPDKTLEEIAGAITSEAERKRRFNNIRADNCTAIVIRIGTKPRSSMEGGAAPVNKSKHRNCQAQCPEKSEFLPVSVSAPLNRQDTRGGQVSVPTRRPEAKMAGFSSLPSESSPSLSPIQNASVGGNETAVTKGDVPAGDRPTGEKLNMENGNGDGRLEACVDTHTSASANASAHAQSGRRRHIGRRGLWGLRPEVEGGYVMDCIQEIGSINSRQEGGTSSISLDAQSCNLLSGNPSSLRRAFTPVSRRRRIATPSPARARTCKLREVPSFFQGSV